MITVDIIFLLTLFGFLVIGSAVGFGRGLRFLADGLFGGIISTIACYFLLGVVLNWAFVQDLLLKFTTVLSEADSWICNILLTIHIDLIVCAVALFLVVQILRKLFVHLLASAFEANNGFVRIINRLLGSLLFLALIAILILVSFQIVAWIQGVDGSFYEFLSGSTFGLDKLFVDNPLNAIITNIQNPLG